jgi:cation diffusion facilitator family transporter
VNAAETRRRRLIRLVALSIAAAIATITLKTLAWAVTGSVGLLSDAAESVVNLIAAVMALAVVQFAERPPDEDHAYGHEKANYLAAGIEGALILLAVVSIAYTAVSRLANPEAIEDVGLGATIALIASAINLAVARILIAAGREHGSLTLEADGRHLMTDVWTSIGVVVGVAAVAITGWDPLDPLIALAVAANIVATGFRLVRESSSGLMDRALPPADLERVNAILERYSQDGVRFHALR